MGKLNIQWKPPVTFCPTSTFPVFFKWIKDNLEGKPCSLSDDSLRLFPFPPLIFHNTTLLVQIMTEKKFNEIFPSDGSVQ